MNLFKKELFLSILLLLSAIDSTTAFDELPEQSFGAFRNRGLHNFLDEFGSDMSLELGFGDPLAEATKNAQEKTKKRQDEEENRKSIATDTEKQIESLKGQLAEATNQARRVIEKHKIEEEKRAEVENELMVIKQKHQEELSKGVQLEQRLDIIAEKERAEAERQAAEIAVAERQRRADAKKERELLTQLRAEEEREKKEKDQARKKETQHQTINHTFKRLQQESDSRYYYWQDEYSQRRGKSAWDVEREAKRDVEKNAHEYAMEHECRCGKCREWPEFGRPSPHNRAIQQDYLRRNPRPNPRVYTSMSKPPHQL